VISWRLVTLAGLFVTALVVSNIIAVKLAEVGGGGGAAASSTRGTSSSRSPTSSAT
jgi:hypothetical protein